MKSIIYVIVLMQCVYMAELSAQHTKKSTPAGDYFWEYLPPGYNQNTNRYPVIIFLHGCGEIAYRNSCDGALYTSTPLTELDKVLRAGPPKEIKNGHNMCFTVNGVQECFIVISPQLNGNTVTSWNNTVLEKWMRYVTTNYRIDYKKIYLTGLSLGGMGTYGYAGNEPAKYFADSLAAIAPVAGKSSSGYACNLALRKTAVWAFHGDADTQVSFSADRNYINTLLACSPGPVPQPLFTIFEGYGHSAYVWNTAYRTDNAYFSPNLYQWFLMNPKCSDSANKPPVVSAGRDTTIILPDNAVALNASASDAGGSITSYAWSQQSGPAPATLQGNNTQNLTASGLVVGEYVFNLKVADNAGAVAQDSVMVTVAPAPDKGAAGWLQVTATSAAGKVISLYYTNEKSTARQYRVRDGNNNYLQFYVKNVSGVPNWNNLKVELVVNYQTRYLLIGNYTGSVGSDWTEVTIPLDDFGFDAAKWQSGGVSSVNFKGISGFGTGILGVDEVHFTGGARPFVWYGDDYTLSGAADAVTESAPTTFFISGRPATDGAPVTHTAQGQATLASIAVDVSAVVAGDVLSIYDMQGQAIETLRITASSSADLIDYVEQPGLYVFRIIKPSGQIQTVKINKEE